MSTLFSQKYNTNFLNIVNAQPSTAISCVAAKKFKQKNINVKNVVLGSSVNTSQLLMFIPKNNRKKPEIIIKNPSIKTKLIK